MSASLSFLDAKKKFYFLQTFAFVTLSFQLIFIVRLKHHCSCSSVRLVSVSLMHISTLLVSTADRPTETDIEITVIR